MNRTFVIGDTHFGHKNIIQYESQARNFTSIEEHDQELARRWNAVVNPRDTVWHVGDVLFGVNSFLLLAHLNGIKRLVLGNHDQYPIWRYQQHFRSIHGAVQVHGAILTHIPVHEHQLKRFKCNIHGHLHSNKLADPRYVCVSAEQTGLAPKLLSECFSGLTAP